MPKKLLNKDKDLPAKAHGKGKVWNIRYFPDSAPGKHNQEFCKGKPPKPKSTDFKEWVAYYECVIGSHIEKLNAMQFDWEPNGDLVAQADAFANVLNDFGAIIKGGSVEMLKDSSTPTAEFEWPLTGEYLSSSKDPIDPVLSGRKLNYFNITIDFQKDPDYEMVVNAVIRFVADYQPDPSSPGGSDDTSGASSYIATSSSS